MKKIATSAPSEGAAKFIESLSEETLDTTERFDVKLAGVSRRDFMAIAKRYGTLATYTAVAGATGLLSAEALAAGAESAYERKYKKPAKHTLKMGAVFRLEHTQIQRIGAWDFVRDLEERTDGEVRIDMLMGNAICSEPVCIQKAMQGIIDIGVSSTQNASSVVPWLNAIDFPYMFQSNGQLYHFFMNPKSDRLYRKAYRDKYKLEMLWGLCEMRKMFMGLKWKDRPPITKIGDIKGTKNRVTNTQLGRIAMQLMDLNPVPVAWTETLDAMKSGLIDGMETWGTATTAFNMTPVVSQYVGINFIPGVEHVAIRSQSLDKLGSALKEQVLESGYMAQVTTMYNNEVGLVTISGEVPNPGPDTLFGKHGVKMNFFSDAALKECEDLASPKKPEYDRWHEKLNELAGFNVYQEMLPVAREYPKDKPAIDVEPRRWWKSV